MAKEKVYDWSILTGILFLILGIAGILWGIGHFAGVNLFLKIFTAINFMYVLAGWSIMLGLFCALDGILLLVINTVRKIYKY